MNKSARRRFAVPPKPDAPLPWRLIRPKCLRPRVQSCAVWSPAARWREYLKANRPRRAVSIWDRAPPITLPVPLSPMKKNCLNLNWRIQPMPLLHASPRPMRRSTVAFTWSTMKSPKKSPLRCWSVMFLTCHSYRASRYLNDHN